MNINSSRTGVYTHNGEEKIFIFCTSLQIKDKIEFVNFVTNTVVSDGNYYSLIKNLIFDFEIIQVMTDVDVSDILKSDNVLGKIEDFLNETNIVEIVKANADDGVIDELNRSVDDNIEYHTGVHRNLLIDSLNHLVNTIDKKIAGIDTDSMMEMAKVISGMSGELTTDRILEAYANSDIFKNKYNQLISDREKHNAEIEATATAIKNTKKKNTKNDSNVIPMN